MSAPEPGQAAYVTWAHRREENTRGAFRCARWDDIQDATLRADWEAAAAAAIAAAAPAGAQGEGVRWLHVGCGGTVTFDISGGWCGVCEAEQLSEGEYAREQQPAPELAAAMAETRKVQDILAAILSQFAKGSSGWTARVGQVPLARAWAATREPVPDELRRFL